MLGRYKGYITNLKKFKNLSLLFFIYFIYFILTLGDNLENLFAEYLIICRKIFDEKSEIFITKIEEIKNKVVIHEEEKNNKKSYWLESEEYEKFKDDWEIIGEGYH